MKKKNQKKNTHVVQVAPLHSNEGSCCVTNEEPAGQFATSNELQYCFSKHEPSVSTPFKHELAEHFIGRASHEHRFSYPVTPFAVLAVVVHAS